MGIITKLNLDQLNELVLSLNIKFVSFIETKNGITDTTYIASDENHKRYVLKIYESSSKKDVQHEIDILNALKDLIVPKVISKNIEFYNSKPYVLYSCIEGKIPKYINLKRIEQITYFLSFLHKVDYKSENKNIYTKDFLDSMLKKVLDDENINKDVKNDFLSKYKKIENIDLSNNAFIHGDLFYDNAKFIDEKLCGVYDFSQSCYGNRYFDLAVMVLSWCFDGYNFNKEFFAKILEIYNKELNSNISEEFLKNYLLCGCLYYSLQRCTRENKLKDYNEFLKRFEIIEKTIKENK
ncbi:phosphotransferase [Arcobacter sp. LA11]|uniref:phosphotransferase n=1 Tax=Arcobacter sp. LA11 TaxID=1898176 RepID=UPI0009335A91|nr:phosphotransferase [Arcobacter sp. LA11]